MNRIKHYSNVRKIFVFAIFCLMFGRLSAEDPHIFAPFVSKLKTIVKDNTVKITWTDSSDLSNCLYRIYRSNTAVTDASFASAVLAGSAPSGQGFFIDTLDVTGEYYYAVLAEESGETYRVFIPFRNTIQSAVSVTVLSPQEMAVAISDIRAEVKNASVLINFTPSRTDRQAVVYRSMSAITRQEDLANAVALKSIDAADRVYQDFPVPGVSYYYAVLDRGLVEYGAPLIDPGKNSTATSILIPLGDVKLITIPAPEATGRTAPLPTLLLQKSLETGARITDVPMFPEKKELTPSAGKAVSTLVASLRIPDPEPFAPVLLPEDLAPGKAAEEVTLSQVLSTSFKAGRYREAETLLTNFLTRPRSESLQRRVRFYLGQSLYFQNEYEKAVLEFLTARDMSYALVEPWIDSALLKLSER